MGTLHSLLVLVLIVSLCILRAPYALYISTVQVNCRLAVSRSLGDRQFKGNGGQPRGSQEKAKGEGQLVSPEPALKSMKLGPQDRVVIVASGKQVACSTPTTRVR